MNWILKYLITKGLTKGLAGGSKGFTVLGLAAMAIRFAQRSSGIGEKTVFSHKMKPGESLIVDTTGHVKKK